MAPSVVNLSTLQRLRRRVSDSTWGQRHQTTRRMYARLAYLAHILQKALLVGESLTRRLGGLANNRNCPTMQCSTHTRLALSAMWQILLEVHYENHNAAEVQDDSRFIIGWSAHHGVLNSPHAHPPAPYPPCAGPTPWPSEGGSDKILLDTWCDSLVISRFDLLVLSRLMANRSTKAPTRPVKALALKDGNPPIVIPAGPASLDYTYVSTRTIQVGGAILGYHPHFHTKGIESWISVVYPEVPGEAAKFLHRGSDKEENNENFREINPPIYLPAGAKISINCRYDCTACTEPVKNPDDMCLYYLHVDEGLELEAI